MSYGERGDRVSASRRRLNEARHRDGLFSPPSEGCIHRERCDRQSCSEDSKTSGEEVEGAKQLLVASSPPRDAADTFSDNSTRPFVRRPPPPDDGGRGEDERNTNNALYCEESKQNSTPGRRSVSSGNRSSSIGNRDGSSGGSRCLLEGGKRGSESITAGSDDDVETHAVLDGGDSREKSLRLRVAGDFVGSVFNECSSAVAWSTSRPMK